MSDKKSNIVVQFDPKSPIVEAFRTIRTNLQFSQVGKDLKIISVTSAERNFGKSTVLANLATVMAQAGHRILVIDGDLRKPTQHKLFGVKNEGVTNIVSVDKDVSECICETGIGNLYVLPAGPIPPNPSEILGSERMQHMLDALKANYDYILVDTPPVLAVTDGLVLATKSDGIILVVSSGALSVEAEIESKRRLEQINANILGVVLNRVHVKKKKYGYGYGHGYGYGPEENSEVRS